MNEEKTIINIDYEKGYSKGHYVGYHEAINKRMPEIIANLPSPKIECNDKEFLESITFRHNQESQQENTKLKKENERLNEALEYVEYSYGKQSGYYDYVKPKLDEILRGNNNDR